MSHVHLLLLLLLLLLVLGHQDHNCLLSFPDENVTHLTNMIITHESLVSTVKLSRWLREHMLDLKFSWQWHEEYGLLGCNCVFQRQPDISEEHITSIFRAERVSQAKNQQKQVAEWADLFLGLLLHPEDGGNIFFWNVGLSLNYMQLQLRKPYSSREYIIQSTESYVTRSKTELTTNKVQRTHHLGMKTNIIRSSGLGW
jgi:hypothetical protein